MIEKTTPHLRLERSQTKVCSVTMEADRLRCSMQEPICDPGRSPGVISPSNSLWDRVSIAKDRHLKIRGFREALTRNRARAWRVIIVGDSQKSLSTKDFSKPSLNLATADVLSWPRILRTSAGVRLMIVVTYIVNRRLCVPQSACPVLLMPLKTVTWAVGMCRSLVTGSTLVKKRCHNSRASAVDGCRALMSLSLLVGEDTIPRKLNLGGDRCSVVALRLSGVA